jgi:peptide/nickel transport system substrate-binding protein
MVTACSAVPSIPVKHLANPITGRYSYTPPSSLLPRGKITFSDSQFPVSVNPLFASSTVDFEVRDTLWASPVVYDQKFHVHPDQLTEVPLPENGDVQDNGKTIIMRLRHDLHWSDGQPILSSDFQYWWHLNQDPATGAVITGGYDQIASIDTPDSFTVVLHMKRPFGPYLLYLPYAAPEHAWKTLQDIDLQNTVAVYRAPNVTDGPYMLASGPNSLSPNNNRHIMVPNPYYTSTIFHGPFVAQLIFQAYDGLAALSSAAQKQQTDLTQGYQEDNLPLLAHLPAGVSTLQTPAAAYEHLDFNNANPLFQDVRVRRAISLAIDKCGLIKDVLHTADCSARLASQVEPPPSLVYDASIQASSFDPQAARALLLQAGWHPNAQGLLTKHGQLFRIRLVTTGDNPLRAAAAEKIRQYLLAVGIQAEIRYYSLGTFFAVFNRGGILATGAFDLAMFAYANSPEPDDEYIAFHSSQIPSADNPTLGNYARVNDAVIDQALTQGRETVVFADRIKFYHQFLERLADQVYIIPLYIGVNIMTVNEHIQNVIPNPNSSDNNWNISDWWVKQ